MGAIQMEEREHQADQIVEIHDEIELLEPNKSNNAKIKELSAKRDELLHKALNVNMARKNGRQVLKEMDQETKRLEATENNRSIDPPNKEELRRDTKMLVGVLSALDAKT